MVKLAFGTALLLISGSAYADEVVIHRDAPAAVVVEHPAPVEHRSVDVERRRDDCASKTVHTENDMGDSRTVTHTDCD